MNLNSVYLVSADPARLAAFYQSVFEMPPRINAPDWVQFRTGTASFAIGSPAEASPGASGATVVFDVANIDAAIGQSEKAGGKLVQKRDMGAHGKTASVRDPEGNLIQFLQKA